MHCSKSVLLDHLVDARLAIAALLIGDNGILFCSELFWPYIGGGEFATKLLTALRERFYEHSIGRSLRLSSPGYWQLEVLSDEPGRRIAERWRKCIGPVENLWL